MAENKLLKSIKHGVLKIAGKKLPCDVLDDETRVISRSAVFKAFGRTKRGRKKGEIRVLNMPSFIDANNLQPFISSDLSGELKTIEYLSKTGRLTSGFRAQIIPLLCDVYLKAREANALTKPQMPLAVASEILVRSLSKVGIVALIDEATGYQDIRKREALQQILKAYISEELLPWTKTFPDEFYKQMFRLREIPYNPSSVKRPSYIGKLTNNLVYKKLPPGVLQELKNRTPKSNQGNYTARFHQNLTLDIGHPTLRGHLQQVIILMKISPDWNTFEKNFVKAFGGQYSFDFLPKKEQDN